MNALEQQIVNFTLAANRARMNKRFPKMFPRVAVSLTREDPSGAEHEIEVEVEYSFGPAEPDVGIMSGCVEVQGVYLQREDGKDGPMLNWSTDDESDFHEDTVPDLQEAECDRAYDAEADRYDSERDR